MSRAWVPLGLARNHIVSKGHAHARPGSSQAWSCVIADSGSTNKQYETIKHKNWRASSQSPHSSLSSLQVQLLVVTSERSHSTTMHSAPQMWVLAPQPLWFLTMSSIRSFPSILQILALGPSTCCVFDAWQLQFRLITGDHVSWIQDPMVEIFIDVTP
jgi:hypothetical protein